MSIIDEKNYDSDKVESMVSKMSFNELIETHKNLCGKSLDKKYYTIEDCGEDFLRNFLSLDSGRSIVFEYTKEQKKFINSKYLSDYIKLNIKKELSNEEVLNIVNSDKSFNEMSEEEIKIIYSALEEFNEKKQMENTKPYTYIYTAFNEFEPYIYKLNGSGVKLFIKNDINKKELAEKILNTSGILPRASYYSGRGVNRGDLNEKNLVEIFKKLLVLDIEYAKEYVKMVDQMKTLGASEFIDSFIAFGENNFSTENYETSNNNVSLNGVYGKARDNVAFISIFLTMQRGNDSHYQDYMTKEIKENFLLTIKPFFEEINDPILNNEYVENKIRNYDYERPKR